MVTNLTPHAITVVIGEHFVTFPPSGMVARVEAVESAAEPLCDELGNTAIPVVRRTTGRVVGLPDDGGPYLVSAMVLAACPGRLGVFAPDTGATAVRDAKGQIVAVRRLVAA
jgi:hypothetical protein